MTTGRVSSSVSGAIATITIDNPDRRNALSAEMWMSFGPILDDLAADPAVKVVIIRGEGGNFSAGADIRDLDRILNEPGLGDGGHVTAAENAIAAFAKPTIAAIEGYCVGGGWEIAGACDLRFASESSLFGITPARIGILYPLSGVERLVGLVGPAVAKFLLFSGELIPAARAAGYGMLTRVVTPTELDSAVLSFAELLASRSQLTIQGSKHLIDLIAASDDRVAAVSDDWQRELAASDDPSIGAAAFFAHEAPAFTWTGPGPVRG